MICPNCSAVNKDNAHLCRKCGIRLSGRMMRPGADKTEKKYLTAGAAAAVALIAVLILFISTFSCICGGCRGGHDENAVNSSVEGEWGVDESPVSGADDTSADVSAADAPEVTEGVPQ